MFFAELAIFVHFNSVGSIFFVLVGSVISVLAFGTRQSDIHAHDIFLLKNKTPCEGDRFL